MNNGVTNWTSTWKWCLDNDLQSSCFRFLFSKIKLADARPFATKTIDFFTMDMSELIAVLAHIFVHGTSFIFMLSFTHRKQKNEFCFCSWKCSVVAPKIMRLVCLVGEIHTLQCLQKIKMKYERKNNAFRQATAFVTANDTQQQIASSSFKQEVKAEICISCIKRRLQNLNGSNAGEWKCEKPSGTRYHSTHSLAVDYNCRQLPNKMVVVK